MRTVVLSVTALVALGCQTPPPAPAHPAPRVARSAGTAPVAPPPAPVSASAAPSSSPPPARPAPEGKPSEVIARIQHAAASPCVESDLPAKYRVKPHAVGPNLGRGIAISLPPAGVTGGMAGKKKVVVFRSYKLDPRSEIGDAGYRVAIKDKSGKIEDLSLGLSQMRPYVIVPNPHLPILDGGVLQVAADLREIDDKSITFPPVGLHAKRKKQGLMLRCPLADLRRDSDHDGLTDLEEGRLATDPADPDTDHDGLRDGDDPAPLGADKPTTPEQEVREAAYEQIVGRFVKGQLLIEKSKGPRLDVRGVKYRLVTLRPDELDAYVKRFGFKVTFHVGVKMKDKDHAKVSISFGWTGGTWNAERTAKGWDFMMSGQWIT